VGTGEAGGGGRGLNRERKRGEGVSAQCDGEHSIRKQMSLPKHASCSAYLSEEFIREEERGALSMKKNAVDGEQKERERADKRDKRFSGEVSLPNEDSRFDCSIAGPNGAIIGVSSRFFAACARLSRR